MLVELLQSRIRVKVGERSSHCLLKLEPLLLNTKIGTDKNRKLYVWEKKTKQRFIKTLGQEEDKR